jgi:gamma-glutamyltranspeptidase/glutathione hydrolase
VNVIDFGMDARQAVDAPRMHHQWLPDRVDVEASLAKQHAATLERLKTMGHSIKTAGERQGDAHTIAVDAKTGRITGAADRRRAGAGAGY